eukprot:comp18555_c0_seq1/m.20035 comp18555_c0_seq1/g.20035  ORF comp18555_c0_seq1/g.20035 comp18555_c0_seq1/m.20035 type:complete len:108 (-) comp18555_c0_seq1:92-415(-)
MGIVRTVTVAKVMCAVAGLQGDEAAPANAGQLVVRVSNNMDPHQLAKSMGFRLVQENVAGLEGHHIFEHDGGSIRERERRQAALQQHNAVGAVELLVNKQRHRRILE